MENIDLLYRNDHLHYTGIKDYKYDSERGIVWFLDKDGYEHEFRGQWHHWESQ